MIKDTLKSQPITRDSCKPKSYIKVLSDRRQKYNYSMIDDQMTSILYTSNLPRMELVVLQYLIKKTIGNNTCDNYHDVKVIADIFKCSERYVVMTLKSLEDRNIIAFDTTEPGKTKVRGWFRINKDPTTWDVEYNIEHVNDVCKIVVKKEEQPLNVPEVSPVVEPKQVVKPVIVPEVYVVNEDVEEGIEFDHEDVEEEVIKEIVVEQEYIVEPVKIVVKQDRQQEDYDSEWQRCLRTAAKHKDMCIN